MQNLIQNYRSKEEQKELAKAIMFYTQVNILRRDFEHIRRFIELHHVEQGILPVPVGRETTDKLTGAFIVLDVSGKIKRKQNCLLPCKPSKKINIFETESLEDKLYNELHFKERARIFKDYELGLDAHITNYKDHAENALKELGLKSGINKEYRRLYKGKGEIGTKTMSALCTAVGFKIPVIVASQTVRSQPKFDVLGKHHYSFSDKHVDEQCYYSLIGTGRVLLFDRHGLEKQAYLEINQEAKEEYVLAKIAYNQKDYNIVCKELTYKFDEKEQYVKLHQKRILVPDVLDALREGNTGVLRGLI